MAAAKPRKSKWADVATVKLVVGEGKTVFHVHEAVLFEESSVFKAFFTSGIREGSERTKTLPEVDEFAFELFVDWLYQGRYNKRSFQAQDHARVFIQFVDLFILAEKYDMPNLKNFAVSQLFSVIRQRFMPSLSTITYAYQHTSQNAAIRKMLADHLAWHYTYEWYQDERIQRWLRVHPEVSTDVNVCFAKQVDTKENPFEDKTPKQYLGKGQGKGM